MNFLKNGKQKEIEFGKLFKNTTITYSTVEEDINEHWDLMISHKIDCKSMGKIQRSDLEKTEHYHYIEIKNVDGKTGSAYGEAEYFAFEIKNYWIVVEAEKLREFIKTNAIKEYVTSIRDENKNPICYKLYQRSNRKDILILVPNYDLCAISCAMIKKEN